MTEDDKQPVFNAPWPALLLALALIAAFVWQLGEGDHHEVTRYAVGASALRAGRYSVLLTSLFLQGGWTQAIMNAVMVLVFATPMSRRMGTDAMGGALFFIFYLVCGLISGLTFCAFHWSDGALAAGTSGALAGCMGAASRLIGGPGLAPFRSRQVISWGCLWVGINVVTGLLASAGAQGVGVVGAAWEAYLGGYLAGLVLIGPALWILART